MYSFHNLIKHYGIMHRLSLSQVELGWNQEKNIIKLIFSQSIKLSGLKNIQSSPESARGKKVTGLNIRQGLI